MIKVTSWCLRASCHHGVPREGRLPPPGVRTEKWEEARGDLSLPGHRSVGEAARHKGTRGRGIPGPSPAPALICRATGQGLAQAGSRSAARETEAPEVEGFRESRRVDSLPQSGEWRRGE